MLSKIRSFVEILNNTTLLSADPCVLKITLTESLDKLCFLMNSLKNTNILAI